MAVLTVLLSACLASARSRCDNAVAKVLRLFLDGPPSPQLLQLVAKIFPIAKVFASLEVYVGPWLYLTEVRDVVHATPSLAFVTGPIAFSSIGIE